MSPATIRHRLQDLPRWHYDEVTESLLRVDVLDDVASVRRWALVVLEVGRRFGRWPTVEICGPRLRLWVRPSEGALRPEDLGFAKALEGALERGEGGAVSQAGARKTLHPRPWRPTLTSLARLLAVAEADALLPEALWLIQHSLPVLREPGILAQLASLGAGETWGEIARLLGQFDRLVETRGEWKQPSDVLEPPHPPVSDFLMIYGLRLESSSPAERSALGAVGRQLEKELDVERRAAASRRVAP